MKLAYLTRKDPSDQDDWSGLTHYIHRSLRESGLEVIPAGPLKEGFLYLTTHLKKFLYQLFLRKNYHRHGDPSLLKSLSRQAGKAISAIEPDVVFGVDTLPLSSLETDKPVVYWHDCVFPALVDYYPQHTRLCAETIRDEMNMERKLLSKCRLAVFSSDWAAETALQHYDVDPKKVKVVPFGANLECGRDLPAVKKIIAGRYFDPCVLLFVGVQWERKGGDLAVRTAELLNQRGIKTLLHVVGCEPPGPTPGFVRRHGFLSKNTGRGRRFLDALYSESHFLLLPSRADCCAVTFAEASSFGLPSLSADVGGNSTAVHNGKNGQIFPPGAPPEAYCGYIAKLMKERKRYERLCLSSFREYEERLNWKTSGKKMRDLILKHCKPKVTMKNV